MKLPDLFGDHKDDSKKEETVADKNVVNESSPENNAISENRVPQSSEVNQSDMSVDNKPGVVTPPMPSTENDLGSSHPSLYVPDNSQEKTDGDNSENVTNIADVREELGKETDNSSDNFQNSEVNNSESAENNQEDMSKVVDFEKASEQTQVPENNEAISIQENNVYQLIEKLEENQKKKDGLENQIVDFRNKIDAIEEEDKGYIDRIKTVIDIKEQEHAKKGEELDNIRNHPALNRENMTKQESSLQETDLAA